MEYALIYDIEELITFKGDKLDKASKLIKYGIRLYLILSIIFLFNMIVKFSEHFLLIIFGYIVVTLLIFILTLTFTTYISHKKQYSSYIKPMNNAVNLYKRNNNSYIFLNNLLKIKNSINGDKGIVVWKFNLSIALFGVGEYKDAYRLISSLNTDDEVLMRDIEAEINQMKQHLICMLVSQISNFSKN